MVNNLPAMQETQVRSLGREYPLEEEMVPPLQYSCMENPMERRTGQATAHRVTKELDNTEQLTLYIHFIFWLTLYLFIYSFLSVFVYGLFSY